MEILQIIIKTIFFYFLIIFFFRFMGKREIAQLSVQDLVVSILIAELVAISIENVSDTLLNTVVPISILVLLEILLSFLSLKSSTFRKIFEGKPVLLINKGKIVYKELVKQRYSLDDLLSELRLSDVKNIEEVEFAVLEKNGRLSVFKYNLFTKKNVVPLPIVLDGKIQKYTLNYLKKDESWLKDVLLNKQVLLEEVFYAFWKNNEIYIIKKNC